MNPDGVALMDENRRVDDYDVDDVLRERMDFLRRTGVDIDELRQLLLTNLRHLTRGHSTSGQLIRVYNFNVLNLEEVTQRTLKDQIEYIFRRETRNAFKINFSFSYVLKRVNVDNNEDEGLEKYRFWYAHANNYVLETPYYISSRQDFRDLIKKLRTIDLYDIVYRNRPSSKWGVLLITNVRYKIWTSSYALGGKSEDLSHPALVSWVKKRRGITLHPIRNIARASPRLKKKLENDNLCLFRNLCCLIFSTVDSKGYVKKETWPSYGFSTSWSKFQCLRWLCHLHKKRVWSLDGFQGVTLAQLPMFERFFQVRVSIFKRADGKSSNTNMLEIFYRSCYDSVDESCPAPRYVMNCLMVGHHLCLIYRLYHYRKSFKCRNCGQLYSLPYLLSRHERRCRDTETFNYVGGPFRLAPTLRDRLHDFGVSCPPLYNKMFCCWDIESCLPKGTEELCDVDYVDRKTIYHNRHIPISVSVASTVGGYEDCHFICERSPVDLIEKFVSYLEEIQSAYSVIMKRRFAEQYSVINTEIDKLRSMEFNGGGIVVKSKSQRNMMLNRWLKLLSFLDRYTEQLVVLGFNCSGYDIEVCKFLLFERLGLHVKGGRTFVIKRAGRYSLLSTPRFRFLDLRNFLSANVNYSEFLKVFQVEQKKFFWPYEYITSYDTLLETSLPGYDAYFSKLKGGNVLEQDYLAFEKHVSNGMSELDALQTIGSISKSQYRAIQLCMSQNEKLGVFGAMSELGMEESYVKTGEDNYNMIRGVWRDHGMVDLRCMLRYYNNLDTLPMCLGVNKLLSYYEGFGVDLFKDCISLPGVSKRVMFNSVPKNMIFYLFDNTMAEHHKKFTKSLCGGYSGTFNRYAEVGKTRIRDGSNLVKSIQGYDATSLYLSTFMNMLPTGKPVLREEANDYYPVCVQDHGISAISIIWLDYVAYKLDIHIKHKLNNGREVWIAPFKVDGYHLDSGTIFMFNGCYWHSCDCMKPKLRSPEALAMWEKRRATSDFVIDYLKGEGYKVVTMRECDFNECIRRDPDLKAFVKSRKTRHSPHKAMTLEMIIKAVEQGSIYGFFDVDIEVPAEMRWYWDQFPPLFGNAIIDFEHYGPFMQQFVRDNGIMTAPRKLLVSAFSAKNIILVSDLLRWYIQKGLVVTAVHCIYEFENNSRPFVSYANDITAKRRAGDLEDRFSILSNLAKTLGNSGYGVLLTKQQDFLKVSYCNDIERAQRHVNSRKFNDLSMVGDSYYELVDKYDRINITLPNHVAFAILNLSKLTMLKFVYDVLDKYLDRSSYSIITMDTDSIYSALASNELISLVRPYLRGAFIGEYEKWFHKCYCPRHEFQFFQCAFRNAMHEWKPCEECRRLKVYHSRDLGRFKLEAKGDLIISLSSKLYYLTNHDRTDYKARAKGVNLTRLGNTERYYHSGLFDRVSTEVTNWGIKKNNGGVWTYSQRRNAFSFLYIKRMVLDDAISTQTLPICLRPNSL